MLLGLPLALWAAIGALRAGRDPALSWTAIAIAAAAGVALFV